MRDLDDHTYQARRRDDGLTLECFLEAGMRAELWRRAVKYKERILKLKAITALKVSFAKEHTNKKLLRPRVKSGHPFMVVALIKDQFGSFKDFIRRRD